LPEAGYSSVMATSISYSTSGFRDRDISAALSAIARAGFASVEVAAIDPHLGKSIDEDGIAAISAALAAAGVAARSVHSPLGGPALGTLDEELRSQYETWYLQYLRAAASWGADVVVFHPIPNPAVVLAQDMPTAALRIPVAVRRTLDALVPEAERLGVRLALENLPYLAGDFPLRRAEELRALVEDYPAASVGIVVDVGHAGTLRNDPAAEIRAAGARLYATHLQDVDAEQPNDDHWAPGEGGLDWAAILQALRDVKYSGTWTFEIAAGRHGETTDQLAAMTHAFAERWIG
jgi:L-ribulose-5-phosphate 3-epimerase